MNEEPKDPNVYVVCDYGATGEGRTVMTLITRVSPRHDLGDFAVQPGPENGWQGELAITRDKIALREFKDRFGDYYAIGAEVIDRYEFFDRYGKHVPEILYKLTDPNGKDIPPGFNWFGSLYYNYS